MSDGTEKIDRLIAAVNEVLGDHEPLCKQWTGAATRHGLSPTPGAEAVPPPAGKKRWFRSKYGETREYPSGRLWSGHNLENGPTKWAIERCIADGDTELDGPPPHGKPLAAQGKGMPPDRSIEDRATAAWSTPGYRHLTGPAAMVKFAHSETARLRKQLSDVTGEREAYRTAAMKLEDEVERVKAEMKRTRAEDQRTIQALIVERDEAQCRLKIHEDELARSSAFPKGWKQPKETPAYVAPTTKGGDRPIVTFKDKPRPSPQRRTTGTRGKGGGG